MNVYLNYRDVFAEQNQLKQGDVKNQNIPSENTPQNKSQRDMYYYLGLKDLMSGKPIDVTFMDAIYDACMFLIGSLLGLLINVYIQWVLIRMGVQSNSYLYPVLGYFQVILFVLMDHYLDTSSFFIIGIKTTQNILLIEWLRDQRGLKI